MPVRDVLLFGDPMLRRVSEEVREFSSRVFEGYFSELLQHEIDHLDGRLFIDHIDRPETITMVEEWDPANATA